MRRDEPASLPGPAGGACAVHAAAGRGRVGACADRGETCRVCGGVRGMRYFFGLGLYVRVRGTERGVTCRRCGFLSTASGWRLASRFVRCGSRRSRRYLRLRWRLKTSILWSAVRRRGGSRVRKWLEAGMSRARVMIVKGGLVA